MTKRYIRLTTERMKWTGQVAEVVDEYPAGPSMVPMYSFKDIDGDVRCVPTSEVEIITEKEFFVEILKGTEKFNDK